MELEVTGALAVLPNQKDFNEDQLQALSQLGLENVDRGNLLIFLNQCQKTGLDPFAKQIYMIARRKNVGRPNESTVYTIQTGIDGFRKIAKASNKYRGQTKTEWCGKDGIWKDVWLGGVKNPPAAARVGVHHADFVEPLYATAVYESYCPMYNDKPQGQWAVMPEIMIAKCAEALALRKAFPQDLSGVYTEDELAQENFQESLPAKVKEDKPQLTKEPEVEVVYTEEEINFARELILCVSDYDDIEEMREWYNKNSAYWDIPVDGVTFKQSAYAHRQSLLKDAKSV